MWAYNLLLISLDSMLAVSEEPDLVSTQSATSLANATLSSPGSACTENSQQHSREVPDPDIRLW